MGARASGNRRPTRRRGPGRIPSSLFPSYDWSARPRNWGESREALGVLEGPPSLLPEIVVREGLRGSRRTRKRPTALLLRQKIRGGTDALAREAGENSGGKQRGGCTNFGVVGLKDGLPHSDIMNAVSTARRSKASSKKIW